MMIPFIQIDAFADRPFTGNPAAVMPLDTWLADDLLQAIARENNLSETAFLIPDTTDAADYELRWFTPALEVPLCGHATLASAHVLFAELGLGAERIVTVRGALAAAAPSLRGLSDQHGMFAQLPVTPAQVARLREQHAVYMAGSGRINLAGLTPATIPGFAAAYTACLHGSA